MKFDFSQVLCDLKGKEIPTPPQYTEDIGPVITLDGACYLALMILDPSKPEDGTKKFKSYEIYRKIKANGDLTVEEVAHLKQKVGDFWSPNVMGIVWDILEGKEDGAAVAC